MTAGVSGNVFSYLDYREALHALYAHKKAHEYGFSHRAFSRRAGLKSTNFLKLVMDGERNLSPDAAQRFARALARNASEAGYFCELVTFNQASNARERAASYERLSKLKPQLDARELDASQNAYHERWYIPAVRELAARDDFREDPAWIADRGREAMDLFPRGERELGAVTLCIDEALLPTLRARIQAFCCELLTFEHTGDRKRVAQVNFQLFPLSKKESPK